MGKLEATVVLTMQESVTKIKINITVLIIYSNFRVKNDSFCNSSKIGQFLINFILIIRYSF